LPVLIEMHGVTEIEILLAELFAIRDFSGS